MRERPIDRSLIIFREVVVEGSVTGGSKDFAALRELLLE
jgi:hypothetical protein